MIYRQLLTIIYQNENYILIKIEHPSLYGEGCSQLIFLVFSINIIGFYQYQINIFCKKPFLRSLSNFILLVINFCC